MALMSRRAAPRTGRGRRGARRRGPGEDAEVRGGAGRAGEDETTRRGGGRPRDDEEGWRVGDDLKAGHGRAPAGDPRTAGEECGGARGRASRGGKKKSGRRGDVDLNWAAPKGVICWGCSVSAGWYYQPALTCPRDVRWDTLVPAGSSSRH